MPSSDFSLHPCLALTPNGGRGRSTSGFGRHDRRDQPAAAAAAAKEVGRELASAHQSSRAKATPASAILPTFSSSTGERRRAGLGLREVSRSDMVNVESRS